MKDDIDKWKAEVDRLNKKMKKDRDDVIKLTAMMLVIVVAWGGLYIWSLV